MVLTADERDAVEEVLHNDAEDTDESDRLRSATLEGVENCDCGSTVLKGVVASRAATASATIRDIIVLFLSALLVLCIEAITACVRLSMTSGENEFIVGLQCVAK